MGGWESLRGEGGEEEEGGGRGGRGGRRGMKLVALKDKLNY